MQYDIFFNEYDTLSFKAEPMKFDSAAIRMWYFYFLHNEGVTKNNLI